MIEKTGMPAIQPIRTAVSGAARTDIGAAEISKQFSSYLNEAIQGIADQQQQVDRLSEQFAAGQAIDTHSLMIASERASLSLELTVQIRNKVIEAYQEIMRTQI